MNARKTPTLEEERAKRKSRSLLGDDGNDDDESYFRQKPSLKKAQALVDEDDVPEVSAFKPVPPRRSKVVRNNLLLHY